MTPITDLWRRFTHAADDYDSHLRHDPELEDIADELGIAPRTCIALLAKESIHPHFHYRHFTKAKADGARRELVEPDETLKAIQRQILEDYLEPIVPHAAAVGFRQGKSIADHVWPHAGANLMITADLQDFFPETLRWRVERWWKTQIESESVAQLFTILTTYQGGLPQGAPTSPALSNLVNVEMDAALERHTRQSGGKYTRFCDDMVFSWRGNDQPPSDFERAVGAVVRESGYTLHPRKGWNIYVRQDEPVITGVVLNRHGTVNIPAPMHKLMIKLARSSNPADTRRLIGYEGYQKMVEKSR